MEIPRKGPPNAESVGDASASPLRRIQARDLMASEREVVIVHAGREYRLRVTNNGKLILTA